MANDNRRLISIRVPLPKGATNILRGKQSVRATFKLSSECIRAIHIVSSHLRIKQKSLFDHLIEDADSLSAIAKELSDIDFNYRQSIQKTYVLSRGSLNTLDEIARDYNASRNALIEYSVQRLLPIIAREREKHQIRKHLLAHVERHYKDGLGLLKKIHASLGPEDIMSERFNALISNYRHTRRDLSAQIERGSLIDEFEAELLRGHPAKNRHDDKS